MPKPIFILEAPSNISMDQFLRATKSLEEHPLTQDYYVICLRGNSDSFETKVFYEKDFNEVKYEELKQLVKDSFNA